MAADGMPADAPRPRATAGRGTIRVTTRNGYEMVTVGEARALRDDLTRALADCYEDENPTGEVSEHGD